ncbi:MAG: hypothetical protein IIW23_00265 [Clostridia bacterium]|nr:hypothetical protein [Clostridia bacterium]
MDLLKQIFPLSFRAKDTTNRIIVLVIYLAAGFVGSFILGVLSFIPIIKYLFMIIGWVLEIYVFAGIVLTLLDYFKVLK